MKQPFDSEILFHINPLKSRYCHLYFVDIHDADFIYDLRLNRKNNFLKSTSFKKEDQVTYLKNYKNRFEDRQEIYYKIYDTRNQTFAGVVRLTDINHEKTFNWQSLVVAESASPNLAIDTMLTIYKIGFELLCKDICGPWEVDKNFVKMMKIHNLIGMAKIIDQDDVYYYVSVKKEDYFDKINSFSTMGYSNIGNICL